MHSGAQTMQTSARRFAVDSEARTVAYPYSWEELGERARQAPEEALIRGLFLREFKRLAPEMARRTYVPFGLYRVREYMELLLAITRAKHPCEPPASALIDAGLGVYSTFASSLAGLVLFSATDADFGRTCKLCSQAYAMTLKPGGARLVRSGRDHAAVELRGVWPFPEVFHCGIWLGAMRAHHVRGTIEVKVLSDCDVDFLLHWEPST